MAKVTLGKKIGYQSPFGVEPITVLNGTDTVTLKFEDDYSKLYLSVLAASGTTVEYEAELIEEGTARVFRGDAASVAAVYAEVGAVDAVGSTYLSTAGGFYFQVADAGEAADWETVTTS